MTSAGFLHAFLWDRGQMTDLGTLGGESSYATAINDGGVVVGFSQIAHSRNSHAFIWRKGSGMKDLGTLGGDQSFAADQRAACLAAGCNDHLTKPIAPEDLVSKVSAVCRRLA